MIQGTGIDMERIDRFENPEESFLSKTFSKKELEYCNKWGNSAPHLAGKFCAKEAYFKATNESHDFSSIEILNDNSGKPWVYIKGEKKERIHCSISHSKDHAIAIVVIEK